MKGKRIQGLVFVLIIASLLIFTGCQKNNKNNNIIQNDNGEGTNEENKVDVFKSDSIVLTVGKIEISYKEALIYILRTKSKYETTMTDKVWSYDVGEGKTFEDVSKQEILDEMSMLKILSQKAEEMKISLDSDEIDEVRDYAANAYMNFSEDDRNKYGIERETIEVYAADNYIAEKVYEVATNNVDTNVSDEEAKKIKVQYIYTEDNKKANEYLKQIKKSKKEKKFNSLLEEALDEGAVEELIGKGEKEKVFEDAAFSLKKGGISPVVEGEKGFYIIYCVSDFDEDATFANKEEIIKERQETAFKKQYAEWLQEYKIKINKKNWEKIFFSKI